MPDPLAGSATHAAGNKKRKKAQSDRGPQGEEQHVHFAPLPDSREAKQRGFSMP